MADAPDSRSKNARIERTLRQIAEALDIPVDAFFQDVELGPPPEPNKPAGEGTAGRAAEDGFDGGVTDIGSQVPPAPSPERQEHIRQVVEMLAAFDRVTDPAEREACLSFVRARASP